MTRRIIPAYYAICCDYGRDGLEFIGVPELTKADVIARIKSGEWQNIYCIQLIADGLAEDVTDDLLNAAEAMLKTEARERADQIAAERDHARDLRKHEVA